MFEYEGGPYVRYRGGLVFVRACPICRRYVKADSIVICYGLDGTLGPGANAHCSLCGRVAMPFMGYFDEEALDE